MKRVAWWVHALRALTYLILAFAVVAAIYPLFFLITTSFKTYNESITWPPLIFPKVWITDNYVTVFTTPGFLRFFFNTAVYAVVGTLACVLISAMAGYAFSKFNFRGKKALFALVLSTMMIPGQVTLIPVYLICAKLGWVNSFRGLIIPGIADVFGIFLVRQFAMGIPNDFFDAARVDGASEQRAFWQIFIPLVMPALTTLIVLGFMGRWNDLFWSLMISTSDRVKTLQLALTSLFRTLYDTRWSELCAAMTIAALPVLILYILFQKYFTEGIVLTSGIKG